MDIGLAVDHSSPRLKKGAVDFGERHSLPRSKLDMEAEPHIAASAIMLQDPQGIENAFPR